jgi:RimJ/RimL family protein N-acetyltransferase
VNLYNIRWYYSRAEIGLFLDSNYWGKGYGSKILKKIIQFSFFDLGLHRLEAHIFPQNEASIRLFEKFGFKKEGICKDYVQNLEEKWQDVIQYSLLYDEFLNN